jgi:hypothetical protein
MKPPRYIVDEDGPRVEVVLDVETYEKLIETYDQIIDIEDSVKAEQEGREAGCPTVPLEQVNERSGRKLRPPLLVRIRSAIVNLASDPSPPGCRKLAGQDKWRWGRGPGGRGGAR